LQNDLRLDINKVQHFYRVSHVNPTHISGFINRHSNCHFTPTLASFVDLFSRHSQVDCEYAKMMEPSEDFADVLTAVQEGEFEVVQEVIGGRIVSVNAVDQSGCSLLHWAAINNRVVIARLLIENGLTKSSPGGVLGETPLQWALRKKYYLMMEVIYKQTQCDLSVKSVQGNDALHLACKLGTFCSS